MSDCSSALRAAPAARLPGLFVPLLVLAGAAVVLPRPASATGCEAPPPAVKDISAERFYIDAKYSVADENAILRNKVALQELDNGLRAIITRSDRWYAKHDAASADCGLTWLTAWANDGAMLGTMNSKQAEYERKWRTAGIAIAYLKLKSRAKPAQRAIIEPWLDRLATRVEASEAGVRNPNNHHYWVGLVATAVGFATDKAGHVAYGRKAFRDGMGAIREDGTLPRELERGQMALHYHNYALAPLVLAAEIAAQHGEDWYGGPGSPIHRLAAFTLAGLNEPQRVEALTGIEAKVPTGNILGWIPFYARRFPDRVSEVPSPSVSYNYSWLGGDLSTLARAWVAHAER